MGAAGCVSLCYSCRSEWICVCVCLEVLTASMCQWTRRSWSPRDWLDRRPGAAWVLHLLCKCDPSHGITSSLLHRLLRSLTFCLHSTASLNSHVAYFILAAPRRFSTSATCPHLKRCFFLVWNVPPLPTPRAHTSRWFQDLQVRKLNEIPAKQWTLASMLFCNLQVLLLERTSSSLNAYTWHYAVQILLFF